MKNNKIFMVHVSVAGSVFVKELNFFKSQGGFREKWGKAWFPVVAKSIEDARTKAKMILTSSFFPSLLYNKKCDEI